MCLTEYLGNNFVYYTIGFGDEIGKRLLRVFAGFNRSFILFYSVIYLPLFSLFRQLPL